jgi:hypothetical protein
MTWLLKIEVETKADAEKVERVVTAPKKWIKLIDIEYEELDED